MMNDISAMGFSAQLSPALTALSTATASQDLAFADALQEIAPGLTDLAHLTPQSDGTVSLADTIGLESSNSKIDKAGHDFEAIFYSLLLKEMRSSIGVEEGGGMFSGEGSDTYGGMFDSFMGQHLASSSKLGIADQVSTYLKNKVGGSSISLSPGAQSPAE